MEVLPVQDCSQDWRQRWCVAKGFWTLLCSLNQTFKRPLQGRKTKGQNWREKVGSASKKSFSKTRENYASAMEILQPVSSVANNSLYMWENLVQGTSNARLLWGGTNKTTEGRKVYPQQKAHSRPAASHSVGHVSDRDTGLKRIQHLSPICTVSCQREFHMPRRSDAGLEPR